MFRDSVRKYCADHCGFEARRATGGDGRGDRSHWLHFGELGWLGICLPEEVGGSGGSSLDHAILFEEFGRALVIEPFLPYMALAAQVINDAGTLQQRKRLLEPVTRGELRIALAHHQSRNGEPVAREAADAYVLNGRKEVVLGGAEADILIVPAHSLSDATNAARLALFLVDMRSQGVVVRKYYTLDGLRACDVVLNEVRVNSEAVLGGLACSSQALRAALEYGMIAACAEMVGAMDGLLWLTRDYLRQRRQYGVALGSLQALQHRMAEMYTEVELARSMLYQGLNALDHPNADARSSRVRRAKAYVSSSGRLVGEIALQLHGGIGMAAEYKASHYFRRLVTLAALFGSPDEHVGSLTSWSGDRSASFSSEPK